MFIRLVAISIVALVMCTSCVGINLRHAVVNGDLAAVQECLNAGMSPNDDIHFGWSAMHLAVINNQPQVLSLLIENSGDVNCRSVENGLTPLILSADNPSHRILDILISKGAILDLKIMSGESALIVYTIKGDCAGVEMLLKAGANPNLIDNEGWTALLYAASNGDTEMVKLLLAYDAAPLYCNRFGENAIGLASDSGHEELATIIRNHMDDLKSDN